MEKRDPDKIESPPEESQCALHPQRTALVICPRCGAYCCISCFHGALKRCHACMLREPGPPTSWADPETGAFVSFWRTLGGAFSPHRSAAAFSQGSWKSALTFALWTFLPLSLLSGIIPFTHTLAFGPTALFSIIGDPSDTEIFLDVLNAGGLGLLFNSAKLALLLAPYHSLCRAYGDRASTESQALPSLQLMLYRAWLIAGGALLVSLSVWALPLDPSNASVLLVRVLSMAPLVLLFSSMTGGARVACGIGPVASLVVVLLPFALLVMVEPLILGLLQPLLPDPSLTDQALNLPPT